MKSWSLEALEEVGREHLVKKFHVGGVTCTGNCGGLVSNEFQWQVPLGMRYLVESKTA